jgi:hypothetical protein
MMFNNKDVGDGCCLSLTLQNDRKPEAKWCLGIKAKPIPV